MIPKHAKFDPKENMIQVLSEEVGYHTKFPANVLVHPTWRTMEWVVERLDSADEEALKVIPIAIKRVLEMQETDPTKPEFGIWPWFLEEPLEEMSPPDWNWADFIGAEICRILGRHAEKLSDELVEELRQALYRAALAIFRRNVGPSYTNICSMGAAVTASAGELLGLGWLTAYGATRFANLLEDAKRAGIVPEYNSPSYYPVSIEAAELALSICQDAAVREVATGVHSWFWEQIGHAYHIGTGAWGGPHARAYVDTLKDTQELWLGQRGLPPHSDLEDLGYVSPEVIQVPAGILQLLRSREETVTEQAFPVPYGQEYDSPDRKILRTIDKQRVFGLITCEDTWTQRRSLMGYATLASGELAILRTRMRHNGEDFASGWVNQTLSGFGALSAFGLRPGRGYWHILFDRPEGDLYTLEELEACYELIAPGAAVKDLGDGLFELTAEDLTVYVRAGESVVDGAPASWTCYTEDGRAVVACKGNVTTPQPSAFEDLGTTSIVAGVLFGKPTEQQASLVPLNIEKSETESQLEYSWGDALHLTTPVVLTTVM